MYKGIPAYYHNSPQVHVINMNPQCKSYFFQSEYDMKYDKLFCQKAQYTYNPVAKK